PGTRELSVSVDRSRAVGGTLKPGEFVDVLSTFGQGANSSTVVMVPHVEVLSIAPSPGESGAQVVVLAAPTPPLRRPSPTPRSPPSSRWCVRPSSCQGAPSRRQRPLPSRARGPDGELALRAPRARTGSRG